MDQTSVFLKIFFIIITFATVGLFYKASRNSKVGLFSILLLMLVQALIGLTGFFQDFSAVPPRFPVLIGPGLLITLILFLTKKGKAFIDSLDIRYLTILHTIRVPVEIGLYFLFVSKMIPELMTFEGYNFDILSGLSAPLIYYLVFVSGKGNKTLLLIWNFICLGLLINIVTIAILSAPLPFQKLAFDQPNIGVVYFPYLWLPGIIVPLALFSQLAAIRQLVSKK